MIYSLGHSTLPWEEFLRLIESLELVVDVRSHPTSRWPQFQQDYLRTELGERYQWWPGLGGWSVKNSSVQPEFPEVDIAAYAGGKFPKHHIAAATPADPLRPVWTNLGLLEYAYYTCTNEFLMAAERLSELGSFLDVGMLCCEALYWRCHRSMIADYLHFRKVPVWHLTPGKTAPRSQAHAQALGNRLERYPDRVRADWESAKLAAVGSPCQWPASTPVVPG